MTPRPTAPSKVLFTHAESMRVQRYVDRVGTRTALAVLGVSKLTLESACDQGRVLASTRARVLEAVEREEARGG